MQKCYTLSKTVVDKSIEIIIRFQLLCICLVITFYEILLSTT